MQKLAEICIRRPVFAVMLIMSLTVVGIFSFFTLGVDRFPKVDFPTVTVTVVNPGASPQEVETEITNKIEEAVNSISGIDELRSVSAEGVSQVFINFLLEKNPDVAAQEVRDKVNRVIPELPSTAETPIVDKQNTESSPVLRIAIGATRSVREVTEITRQQIKERLENVPGVGQVRIIGGQEREIQLLINPERLRAYNLTVNEVVNAVRSQNLELPGGRITEGTTELTVRTMGRIVDPAQFNELAIATRGNSTIRIRDIGQALDTAEEARSTARLNGRPAVILLISRQSGENTVAVAEAIKARLAEILPTLPKDFQVQIVGDQSLFIKTAVKAIQTHLLEGGLLAAIVVLLFLRNWRSTIISAVAIPTSIISTFGLMQLMGYTLNQITMLALTLMVGIVIDDAIVVLENIFRFIEEKGYSPFEAAVEATREIGLAVMATTLSLIAVFLPVGFMGGIVGRFMSSFGLTAAFSVVVSLLVSFTLTPMLSARLLRPSKSAHSTEQSQTPAKGVYYYVEATYLQLLAWSMRHRFVMVLLIVTVIASTFPLFKRIGKNFLPSDDESQFEVVVRAPEGYSLLATSTLIERMAKDLRQIPDIIDILTTVGENGQNAVNAATIYIKLKPLEARVQDQFYYMKLAREIVKQYPKELRTSIQPVGLFGAAGRANADVQYLLSGPDLQKLTEYSQKVLEKLRAVPNVFDPDTSLILGKPELRVVIDRERADDLGVKAADIAQALNVLVAGQEISTFNVGKEQYEIRVRAAGENRANRLDLTRMVLASSKVGTVTLDKVARLEAGTGPATIEHFNRQRQIILFANVSADGSQSDVLNKIAQFFQEIQPEPGYIGAPVGRSKELARTGYYFAMAFVLSFIFMYMVLAAQFESFIHPITILLTLPLAIPFGILAMFLANQTVNIYCGLGLLVLFGVVKKNAILQIDHTNGLRQQGMGRYEAIMQANRDRLRPILMTTVALVAGMIPLVFATGPGSGTNRSIGVLVVGGQSFCLLLTLLAVPVLYSLFEDLGDGFRRLIGGTYQGMTQTIAQDVATKPFAQSTKQKD